MKKYIILMIVIIIAVTSISYLYHIKTNKQIEQNNKYYTQLYNKIISGNDIATIINKTLDNNNKNEVEKDERGYYSDNGTNSIIMEIKFLDSDKTFRAEQISKNNIEDFIKLYSNIEFKCTKIEKHEKTGLIKYIYYEQIN